MSPLATAADYGKDEGRLAVSAYFADMAEDGYSTSHALYLLGERRKHAATYLDTDELAAFDAVCAESGLTFGDRA